MRVGEGKDTGRRQKWESGHRKEVMYLGGLSVKEEGLSSNVLTKV